MFTLLNDVRQKKPAVNIRPGIFYSEIDGVVIKVAGKDRDGKGVRDIIIYDYTTPEASRYNGMNITLAGKGEIEMSEDERFMTLTLIDGVNYSEKIESREQVQSRPLQRTSFSSQKRTIDLSAFAFSKTNEEFFKDDFRMLSIRQLNHTIDSMYGNYYTEKETYTQELFRVFRNMYADTIALGKQPDRMPPVDSMLIRRRAMMAAGHDPVSPVIHDSMLAEGIPSYHPQFGDSISPYLLDNFREEEQRNIIATALQVARSSKETMTSRFSILDSRIRLIRKYEIEWHRKFTLSFACLILFFIGAPLGAIIRKGGLGMPAVVSVVLFIVFHVLSMTGDKLARESTVTPAAGMWMASLIILPAGIFLTFKATSDAALLDIEAWGKVWKKIIRRREHAPDTPTDQ
jgi:lipopolysaccharide export system permease protein